MRIICPTCASHYEVEVARIAAQGQLVRCARCRDVWLVRSPDEAAAAPLARAAPLAVAAQPLGEAPSGEVVDIQAARVRLRSRAKPAMARDWATSLGVFAFAALLLASATALPSFRTTIASTVPGAASLYAALGLPVSKTSLALENVRSVLVADEGETVLTLQGKIANTGAAPAPVPNLTVIVRDDGKVPLYTYTAAAPKPMLARGESIDFSSRLVSPPATGHDVHVSFAEGATPSALPKRP